MTPDWIQAVTSIVTVVAAIAAGVYARRAAIYTKKQSDASDRQVTIAVDALAVTREQAATAAQHADRQAEMAKETLDLARAEGQAADRRYEETRLDPLVPSVLATARYRNSLLTTQGWETGSGTLGWTPFWNQSEVGPLERQNPQVRFRFELVVTLENVSDQVARIDIIDPVGGETDVPRGTAIIVPPRSSKAFKWTRTLTPAMLATDDEIGEPNKGYFNLTFWVRDLGMNVRDTYRFNADLRTFQLDGSRLIVRPEPEHAWKENVAQLLQERVYERLEKHRAMTVDFNSAGAMSSAVRVN